MSLAPEIPVTKKRPALELLLGRIQQNARAVVRSVRPVAAPVVAKAEPAAQAPPAQEKIGAFDERWSSPPRPPLAAKPAAAVAPAAPPAPPAQEKIDAFDDRWSSPPRPPLAAKPAAAKPAPIAAPTGDRASRLSSLLSRIQKNRR